MESKMTREKAKRLLKDAAERLGEHFDAVEIVACFRDGELGDQGVSAGSGNWFARRALIGEWIDHDKAKLQAEAIAKTPPEEETDA